MVSFISYDQFRKRFEIISTSTSNENVNILISHRMDASKATNDKRARDAKYKDLEEKSNIESNFITCKIYPPHLRTFQMTPTYSKYPV